MKNKTVAATLALLMGIFGVHRFYLGQRFLGISYLLLFFFTFGLTVDEEAPFILAPALIGFIDAVLLFVMPQEEFDDKYNYQRQGYQRRQTDWRGDYRSQPSRSYERSYGAGRTPRHTEYKRQGVQLFRDYNFAGAVQAFEQALDEKFDDPSTHFNLACSYSMLEEANPAFYHLEKAIEFGFTNLEKIHHHDALAFVRSLSEFEAFVDNDYRQVEALPQAHSDTESTGESTDNTEDLLDQIIKLGDLRDKGILTEQEFAKEKKKLLGE